MTRTCLRVYETLVLSHHLLGRHRDKRKIKRAFRQIISTFVRSHSLCANPLAEQTNLKIIISDSNRE